MDSFKIQILTYLSGIWDRRWYCLLVAWVLCVVGWVGVALIPDRYQVEAKVYIDTDSLMGPLMKGLTVSADTDQQISVMLRTLISRPNLEQVLRATDPGSGSYSPADIEVKVQHLNDDINIKPLGGKNLFSISYVNPDPQYAETVTQALLSLLMESSFGDKRRDMEGAESFLDAKITEYETSLRESERRVAEFKRANADYLGIGNHLDAARASATAAKAELDLAETRREAIREQLAATPPTIEGDAPVVYVGGGIPGNARAATLQRIEQLKQSLADLQSRFTDEHPDVIATKKMLTDAEAQLHSQGPDEPHDSFRAMSNPVYTQLRLRLADEETNVALQERKLQDAQAEISVAKETAQKVAEVQAKAQDLDRDYGILEKNYQELLARREAARLTKAQDERQQNISFRVVEPPKRSQHPIAPNRPLFNTIVLLLGVMGGVAVGVVITLNKGSFLVSEQLSDEFDLPIIGVVTAVRRPEEARQFRVAALGVTASVALLFLCYIGVLVTLTTSVRPSGGA